ncbi:MULTISPECIES: class I SAM-dependent methyltransferase [Ensifer]|uniref:Methyltransferase n=1 Tax=Ensifer canadensis TaxID=555315 RepID=A0AAW4FPC2_9HYPH|nr:MULTISPECIES: methyltransferase [Ensifer]AHK42652.1 putative methyltransferase protein [Ensifer adhaerens OV14]KQU77360.1 nicotinamide N-methyase [Ensifer sp. Root31]KQW56197.1 nicotinamide N-methyase [Ensifer sp. Root127]MBD9489012.1 methyltransferase [Ensifer sp. ENS11]MBM3093156.1 methyltransferase [Ensifer canadensis]
MKTDPESFIRANTDVLSPPHVPEIRLHLATEAHELWLKTEEELEEIGLPPPFWAFAWAGGQGLARYIIDHPEVVRGRRVVDFASGSGLVAIAAMKAGAASVLAADIDPWAETAVRLNAELNGVDIAYTAEDITGRDLAADLCLAGDVFYDKSFAERLLPWFTALSSGGATVIVGDPGRSYCPRDRMTALATYEVPVTRALEDSEVKRTTVWQFGASTAPSVPD